MKTIESVSNKEVKELCKLHKKKERDKTKKFLVEGEHLVKEAYQAGVLEHLYALENSAFPIETTICSQAVLNKLSMQKSDAKLIGLCRKPAHDFLPSAHVLMLNEVQDPGNVGTLIRSAHSFGFQTIYLTPGCADPTNEKAIQASQGAIFQVEIKEVDPLEQIAQLKAEGYRVYATALQRYSQFLHEISFPQKICFVLGNEGSGLPSTIMECCSACIKIDMACFESLNVAIAGSICMYAAFTQKKAEG